MRKLTPTSKSLISVITLLIFSLACSELPFQDFPQRPVEPPVQISGPTNTGEVPVEKPEELQTENPGIIGASTSTAEPRTDMLISPPDDAAGACANPLFPMVPGYQWVYEIDSDTETTHIRLTVIEVQGDQAILSALNINSGITSELTVDCSDGEILNFPTILLGFLFGDVGGEIEIEHVDGIYAPSYDYLVENVNDAEWSGEYLAFGEITAVIDGDQYVGILNESPLHMDWKVDPSREDTFELVEVPAGRYQDAIRVTREIELDFDVPLTDEGSTTNLSAVLELETTSWYVANIGMVRQEVADADVRLYGVRLPLVVHGDIELIEFSTNE